MSPRLLTRDGKSFTKNYTVVMKNLREPFFSHETRRETLANAARHAVFFQPFTVRKKKKKKNRIFLRFLNRSTLAARYQNRRSVSLGNNQKHSPQPHYLRSHPSLSFGRAAELGKTRKNKRAGKKVTASIYNRRERRAHTPIVPE